MAKTNFEKFVAVICLIAFLSVIIAAVGSKFGKEEPMVFKAFERGTRPEGEKLALTMPGADDAQGQIDFLVDIYARACANYQATEDVAFMVQSTTKIMGVDVPGNRFCVKNADKWHYIEYSFVPDSGVASALVGLFSASSTKYADAQYTDATMDYVLSKKVMEPVPTVSIDEVTGENVYDVDWTGAEVTEKPKPAYYAGQTEKFQFTDHTIDATTVTSCKATYNEAEGYYTFEFTLDPNLAPAAITLPKLREGAGSGAYYTKLEQTMEVWDNGHIRYFRAMDYWEGGPLGASSIIDFRTTYYYDEYWTSVENYQYMKDFCNGNR